MLRTVVVALVLVLGVVRATSRTNDDANVEATLAEAANSAAGVVREGLPDEDPHAGVAPNDDEYNKGPHLPECRQLADRTLVYKLNAIEPELSQKDA